MLARHISGAIQQPETLRLLKLAAVGFACACCASVSVKELLFAARQGLHTVLVPLKQMIARDVPE